MNAPIPIPSIIAQTPNVSESITDAQTPTAPTRKRVIVVGGGISGLTTAWRLKNARPDLDILLLERGPCVGGVAQTWDIDGYSVDLGPGTCAPSAERIASLVDDLGPNAAMYFQTDNYKKSPQAFARGSNHP